MGARVVCLRKEVQASLDAFTMQIPQQTSATQDEIENEHARQVASPTKSVSSACTTFSTSTPPSAETEAWQVLELPVDFRSREQRDAYIVCAKLPNLDARTLRL